MLAARGIGVIEIAHTLNLVSPVFHVLSEAVFLRARADKLAPWLLVVLFHLPRDLGFKLDHGQRRTGEVDATSHRLGLWHRRLIGKGQRGAALRLSQDLLLLGFKLRHFALRLDQFVAFGAAL